MDLLTFGRKFGYYFTEASLENNIKTEMPGEEMELPNIVNYWYGLNVIYQTVPTMHDIHGIYPGFFGRDNPLFHYSIILSFQLKHFTLKITLES
jgi:hypothetical protein